MSETTTTTADPAAAMPGPGSVAWFEIGTPDPGRVRRFYGELFGWSYQEDGPYSVITTGPGHLLMGGIQDTGATPPGTPATYAVPCVQVADVAAVCRQVQELGGSVVVPATDTPMGLVYAHVADPTGGHIGIFAPPS